MKKYELCVVEAVAVSSFVANDNDEGLGPIQLIFYIQLFVQFHLTKKNTIAVEAF